MPDTTKYRALLATVLEEEGLTLHGLTPFAPLEDHLLPCRAASRLPEKPCAAVMILFGFWRSASDLTVKEAYDARRYREKTELLCYQSKEYERELDLYQEILEAVSEETERKRK